METDAFTSDEGFKCWPILICIGDMMSDFEVSYIT